MSHEMKKEYPGGWMLTDDSCMQYVRRHGPLEFELIEYSMVSQDGPLYEVYTDRVHLPDYDQLEVEDILNGFGYGSVEEVYALYPSRDEANQVIAESIFEHYGSFHAKQLCEAVPEAFAQKTIENHLLLHKDIPEHHWSVEVSMEELASKMVALEIGETLDFQAEVDENHFGVARLRLFDADTLIINNYGGGYAYAIDIEWSEESSKEDIVVMELKRFCEGAMIHEFYTTLQPQNNLLPDVAQKMRDRDRGALPTKDELLEQLSEGGYTDRELSHIRDEMMEKLGFDPVWRYPFCHDGGLGAVLIPVKEGFLWLPYNIIDIEDNEVYDAENARLLDAESCEHLLQEMQEYVESLAAVMRYVVDELKESESKKKAEAQDEKE